jgi:RecA/RadA recombinase
MKAINPSLRLSFHLPDELPPLTFYPSGIAKVDALLGSGHGQGLAAGRVIEFFGPQKIGKSTLALYFHPEVYLDVERKAEPKWLKKLSPETEVAQPGSAEEAWEAILTAAKAGCRLVVLDSLGAMVSASELDDKGGTAALPRNVSYYLRRILPSLGTTTLLVVNQVRATMGSVPGFLSSPGGHYYHHMLTQQVEFKPRGEWVTIRKEGKDVRIGHAVRLVMRANAIGAPYVETLFYIAYDHGIVETEDQVKELWKG